MIQASKKQLKNTMNYIFKLLLFIYQTRKSWWYTSTCRTKARFIRTFLGSFWLGLSNLLSIAVLAGVYGTVFKVANFKDYSIYLGLGLVVWNYISSSVLGSAAIFEINSMNIKNSNINPIFYVVEEWAFQLQTFAQSFSLVLLVLSFLKVSLISNFIIYSIPGLINLLIFLFWFPLLVCMAGARFQDIYQLVPIIMQLLFLLTPILYKKENLSSLAWVADYNIFYIFLSTIRDSMIFGEGIFLKRNIFVLLFNLTGLLLTLIAYKKIRKKIPFYI